MSLSLIHYLVEVSASIVPHACMTMNTDFFVTIRLRSDCNFSICRNWLIPLLQVLFEQQLKVKDVKINQSESVRVQTVINPKNKKNTLKLVKGQINISKIFLSLGMTFE